MVSVQLLTTHFHRAYSEWTAEPVEKHPAARMRSLCGMSVTPPQQATVNITQGKKGQALRARRQDHKEELTGL